MSKKNIWLPLIGVGKLAKSAVLFGASFALRFLRKSDDVTEVLERWADAIHVDPNGTHLHELIERVAGVDARHLHFTAIALFAYATLFAVEGTGLILRKRWAEYVTVVMTALLLPLEVWELFHAGHTVIKAVVLVLNLAILAYLVWYLLTTRKGYGQALPVPAAA